MGGRMGNGVVGGILGVGRNGGAGSHGASGMGRDIAGQAGIHVGRARSRPGKPNGPCGAGPTVGANSRGIRDAGDKGDPTMKAAAWGVGLLAGAILAVAASWNHLADAVDALGTDRDETTVEKILNGR